MSIVEQIPASEYHRRDPAIASKSGLDELRRSPAHYLAWCNEPDDPPTPAMEFGTAFHCALLEPARFASEYAALPDFGDCRRTANKERRDAWRAENAGKIELGERSHAAITRMVESIRRHPLGAGAFRDGKSEVSLSWLDERSAVQCKGRADFWLPDVGLIIDVKSTENASAKQFAKDVANYGYHRQAAFYRRGFAANGFGGEDYLIFAIEKAPPYAVAVYQLDGSALEIANDTLDQDLAVLARCLATNEWPAYGDGIQQLSLPPWA